MTDPASSFVMLWKSTGFRVKPGMTKRLLGDVLLITTSSGKTESSHFIIFWTLELAPDSDPGFAGVTTLPGLSGSFCDRSLRTVFLGQISYIPFRELKAVFLHEFVLHLHQFLKPDVRAEDTDHFLLLVPDRGRDSYHPFEAGAQ